MSGTRKRPDMRLRSGKNIPRATTQSNEIKKEHSDEEYSSVYEGYSNTNDADEEEYTNADEQENTNANEAGNTDADGVYYDAKKRGSSLKLTLLKVLILPTLVLVYHLPWPSEHHWETLLRKARALFDRVNPYSFLPVIPCAIAIRYLIPFCRIRQFCFLVLMIAVLSYVAGSMNLSRTFGFASTNADYSKTNNNYASVAQHLTDIDVKMSEQAVKLELMYHKTQHNSNLLYEQLQFLSAQIKEQQSQLNFQREDYRRIWDALYTQNQYMLSVSDDIKLDVIEALHDNTVAVFDKKNKELKVSPDFLEYMQTADFIQSFIQQSTLQIREFIQQELQNFFLDRKDDHTMEKAAQFPPSLEQFVETAVKKYSNQDDEPDFALRTRGGRIVLSKTSKTYQPPITTKSLLRRALGYYSRTRSPWAVIDPSVQVGECWSMQGSNGSVGISLSRNIFLSSLTLEHPSANVLLDDIINAPRKFKVFALTTTPEELILIGEFEYDIHLQKKTQRFLFVGDLNRAYNTIIVQFMSNWGNPHFTDIYRIKISGTPAPQQA